MHVYIDTHTETDTNSHTHTHTSVSEANESKISCIQEKSKIGIAVPARSLSSRVQHWWLMCFLAYHSVTLILASVAITYSIKVINSSSKVSYDCP